MSPCPTECLLVVDDDELGLGNKIKVSLGGNQPAPACSMLVSAIERGRQAGRIHTGADDDHVHFLYLFWLHCR